MARVPKIEKDWRLFNDNPTKQHRRNVRKWVKWLEEKRLPQGFGKIAHEDGGHCCLGVGAKVAGWGGVSEGAREGYALSASSMHLAEEYGTFGNALNDDVVSLVGLNDGLKLTHPQIAKFVRKMWKHQFGEEL